MRRTMVCSAVALLTLGLVGAAGSAGAASGSRSAAEPLALRYLKAHGYLPIHGVGDLARAKADAAAWAARQHPATATVAAAPDAGPTVGASWQGLNDPSLS